MKLIVGLGNPGREYDRTRHNVGFRVLDILAERLKTSLDRNKFKAEYGSGELPRPPKDGDDDGKVLVVKPQTFMNLSGESVVGFSGFYKTGIEALLVVLDDVALPVGSLRIRRGGSDGGHNGLKNITLRLGSKEYARLRIGVGGRESGGMHPADLAGHVLSRFSSEEEEILKKQLDAAADAALVWAQDGIDAAMNTFNGGS